ncbi:MAG: heterodisulfide reductase-related iron-sulfur binding cluster [Desulfobacterales bacterium]
MKDNPSPESPEEIARRVIRDCADCECCRPILDEACLFFPELYRLYDREKETGRKPTAEELRALVERCNFCALCPCPNIRADIIRAKTAFVSRDGLPPRVRLIEDVARLGRICGAFPRLTDRLLSSPRTGERLKRWLGIHPERRLPAFPREPFTRWARKRGLHRKPQAGGSKVLYFAGCTATYLFPEVACATVEVLQAWGLSVFCPPLSCCGMPSFLEGDREFTLRAAAENLELLSGAAEEGYDILCSCPTCSFMLRGLLAEGAYFSEAYQGKIGADPRFIRAPARARAGGRPAEGMELFDRTIFENILKDEGYFSGLDPLRRIAVAEKTFDVGEYLLQRVREGAGPAAFSPVRLQALYYPPCHQREQQFGRPYLELLRRVPGLETDALEGNLYCCGLAGVMGFKQDFHEASIAIGDRLMRHIAEAQPQAILTDCLSCRLQFRQLLPYPVRHPIEILQEALRPAAERRPQKSGETPSP